VLFLKCDDDLTAGDLVEISGFAGLACLLNSPSHTRPEELQENSLALFCDYVWVDYKIDKELVPLVVHEGRPKIVSRGQVKRVRNGV
jgi:hypothetical protein